MAYKEAESKVGKYADVKVWNKKGEIKQGDMVEGYLVDKEIFNTKFGVMETYIIKTPDGLVKINGQTDIRNKMNDIADRIKDKDEDADIIGIKMRITYAGITETANGAMKTYLVEYDDEDRSK